MNSQHKQKFFPLSKKSYRQVVKKLEYYRQQQHEEDRGENPGSIPLGWGMVLKSMIENTVRQNGERCNKQTADQALEYLVKQGLLVRYAGDYTFPRNDDN